MPEQDFHLRMKDPSAETPAVRAWLDECERRIKAHLKTCLVFVDGVDTLMLDAEQY